MTPLPPWVSSRTVGLGALRLHYLRAGTAGAPKLVLLHGWPEFSRVWLPVMARLRERFDLIAPDLRGFGDSDKPDGGPSDRAGPEVHAGDVTALADALALERFGIVCHDIGAYVAQVVARQAGDRLHGLFFFDAPYPGIGARWAAAGQINEIWYQSFHQQPFAAALVGASRQTCRAYFRHFLTHWAHRKTAFDDLVDDWVENFMKPGNLQGGFNWYVSVNKARLEVIAGTAAPPPPIAVPTRVLWGRHDPILRSAWADRLGEFFPRLQLSFAEGSGHFPHVEEPDLAAAAITAFFGDRRA